MPPKKRQRKRETGHDGGASGSGSGSDNNPKHAKHAEAVPKKKSSKTKKAMVVDEATRSQNLQYVQEMFAGKLDAVLVHMIMGDCNFNVDAALETLISLARDAPVSDNADNETLKAHLTRSSSKDDDSDHLKESEDAKALPGLAYPPDKVDVSMDAAEDTKTTRTLGSGIGVDDISLPGKVKGLDVAITLADRLDRNIIPEESIQQIIAGLKAFRKTGDESEMKKLGDLSAFAQMLLDMGAKTEDERGVEITGSAADSFRQVPSRLPVYSATDDRLVGGMSSSSSSGGSSAVASDVEEDKHADEPPPLVDDSEAAEGEVDTLRNVGVNLTPMSEVNNTSFELRNIEYSSGNSQLESSSEARDKVSNCSSNSDALFGQEEVSLKPKEHASVTVNDSDELHTAESEPDGEYSEKDFDKGISFEEDFCESGSVEVSREKNVASVSNLENQNLPVPKEETSDMVATETEELLSDNKANQNFSDDSEENHKKSLALYPSHPIPTDLHNRDILPLSLAQMKCSTTAVEKITGQDTHVHEKRMFFLGFGKSEPQLNLITPGLLPRVKPYNTAQLSSESANHQWNDSSTGHLPRQQRTWARGPNFDFHQNDWDIQSELVFNFQLQPVARILPLQNKPVSASADAAVSTIQPMRVPEVGQSPQQWPRIRHTNVKRTQCPVHSPRYIQPLPSGKVLCLMRGCPGSGKSTLAKKLVRDGVILSTDDYYMVNGQYIYDPKSVGEAHDWNKKRARDHLERGTSPIIIDNTNIMRWEMKPYVSLALKHQYQVVFREPTAPWKCKVGELAKRNSHGVPKTSITRMLQNFERNVTVENVMNAHDKKTVQSVEWPTEPETHAAEIDKVINETKRKPVGEKKSPEDIEEQVGELERCDKITESNHLGVKKEDYSNDVGWEVATPRKGKHRGGCGGNQRDQGSRTHGVKFDDNKDGSPKRSSHPRNRNNRKRCDQIHMAGRTVPQGSSENDVKTKEHSPEPRLGRGKQHSPAGRNAGVHDKQSPWTSPPRRKGRGAGRGISSPCQASEQSSHFSAMPVNKVRKGQQLQIKKEHDNIEQAVPVRPLEQRRPREPMKRLKEDVRLLNAARESSMNTDWKEKEIEQSTSGWETNDPGRDGKDGISVCQSPRPLTEGHKTAIIETVHFDGNDVQSGHLTGSAIPDMKVSDWSDENYGHAYSKEWSPNFTKPKPARKVNLRNRREKIHLSHEDQMTSSESSDFSCVTMNKDKLLQTSISQGSEDYKESGKSEEFLSKQPRGQVKKFQFSLTKGTSPSETALDQPTSEGSKEDHFCIALPSRSVHEPKTFSVNEDVISPHFSLSSQSDTPSKKSFRRSSSGGKSSRRLAAVFPSARANILDVPGSTPVDWSHNDPSRNKSKPEFPIHVDADSKQTAGIDVGTMTEAQDFSFLQKLVDGKMNASSLPEGYCFITLKVSQASSHFSGSDNLEVGDGAEPRTPGSHGASPIPVTAKLHKSSMTEEVIDQVDMEDEKVILMRTYFPASLDKDLKDLLETCGGDVQWATNIMLDSLEELAPHADSGRDAAIDTVGEEWYDNEESVTQESKSEMLRTNTEAKIQSGDTVESALSGQSDKNHASCTKGTSEGSKDMENCDGAQQIDGINAVSTNLQAFPEDANNDGKGNVGSLISHQEVGMTGLQKLVCDSQIFAQELKQVNEVVFDRCQSREENALIKCSSDTQTGKTDIAQEVKDQADESTKDMSETHEPKTSLNIVEQRDQGVEGTEAKAIDATGTENVETHDVDESDEDEDSPYEEFSNNFTSGVTASNQRSRNCSTACTTNDELPRLESYEIDEHMIERAKANGEVGLVVHGPVANSDDQEGKPTAMNDLEMASAPPPEPTEASPAKHTEGQSPESDAETWGDEALKVDRKDGESTGDEDVRNGQASSGGSLAGIPMADRPATNSPVDEKLKESSVKAVDHPCSRVDVGDIQALPEVIQRDEKDHDSAKSHVSNHTNSMQEATSDMAMSCFHSLRSTELISEQRLHVEGTSHARTASDEGCSDNEVSDAEYSRKPEYVSPSDKESRPREEVDAADEEVDESTLKTLQKNSEAVYNFLGGMVLQMDAVFVLQLQELFGAVGFHLQTDALSPDDLKVKIGYHLARDLHLAWSKGLEEKFQCQEKQMEEMLKRDEELAMRLQKEENLKKLSKKQRDKKPLNYVSPGSPKRSRKQQESEQSGLGDAAGNPKQTLRANDIVVGSGLTALAELGSDGNVALETGVYPPPVQRTEVPHLAKIIAEEEERKRAEEQETALYSSPERAKSIATKLKRDQLYEAFPDVDKTALEDIFIANNYDLECTKWEVSAVYEESANPVKTVFGAEPVGVGDGWQQKGSDSDDGLYQSREQPDYDDYRAEATLHYKQREECFKKAAKAYHSGQKELAVYYSNQGRLHSLKMKEADRRAAEVILEQRKREMGENKLDLHNLHVEEALQALQEVLIEKQKLSPSQPRYLEVITGRGRHSQGGVAKLKPAVENFLHQQRFRFSSLNAGSIRVYL